MAKKIVIIGGSGFIGTTLTRHLLEAGHNVTIADLKTSKAYPESSVSCDVCDVTSLRAACEGADIIYNLAAEHRDDVTPISRYYDVNVEGAKNICQVAKELRIPKIVFTSTVAVYGFHNTAVDESTTMKPFNHYGRSKLDAEQVFKAWVQNDNERSLTIIRPTAIFGEENRGNVYNLMHQIATGRFLMVGKGENKKSIAYVENIAAFLAYALDFGAGTHIYNYADGPDLTTNELVSLVYQSLNRRSPKSYSIPYPVGMMIGYSFDVLAKLLRRKFPVSSIRVKKFTANTQYAANKAFSTGFTPPYKIEEALTKTIQHEF